jgi:hypothetical protein
LQLELELVRMTMADRGGEPPASWGCPSRGLEESDPTCSRPHEMTDPELLFRIRELHQKVSERKERKLALLRKLG